MRTKKMRMGSILLTMTMLTSLLPMTAFADDVAAAGEYDTPAAVVSEEAVQDAAVWDGSSVDTSWYDGAGQAEAYTISTAAQLAGLARLVNEGTTAFKGKTVNLEADIDLGGREWTPIGGAGTGKAFQGTFDGGTHTISNLKITKGLTNTAANNAVGLFGACNGGSAALKNFTVNHADVQGCLNVGAALGDSSTAQTKLINVHVTGSIQIAGWWYVGGLLGKGYCTVTDCSVEGDGADTSYVSITGGYAGGITGFMGEGNCVTSGCTVKNMTVSGAYNGIGGVNGILHYGNTIQGCTLENMVVWQTTEPEEDGRIYCGAFAGTYLDNGGKNCPTLSGCEFTGRLYGGPDMDDILEATRYVGSLWYGAEPPATVKIQDCTIHMPPAAQIGTVTYKTLAEAIAQAKDGDTIRLLTNITLDTPVSVDNNAAYALAVHRSITIDGTADNGGVHTITVSTARGIGVKGADGAPADVTFQNLKIQQTTGRSCIETRGNLGSLTLENVTLDTSAVKSGNSQALTIGGRQESKAKVVLSNSTITAGKTGYGVITFNPVDLKITGTVLTGWAPLYFKAPDSSAGSAGSTVTVHGDSVLNSKNEAGAAEGWNQFGAIVFEDNDITVTLSEAALTVTSQSPNERQQAVSFGWYGGDDEQRVTGNKVLVETGANITVTGDQAVFAQPVDGNEIAVSGGVFNTDPTAYVVSGCIAKRTGTEEYTYTVVEKVNLTDGIYMSDPTGATASNYHVTQNEDGTWSVYYRAPSGGSSSSGNKTETVTHPDGSVTTTVTRPDGSATTTTTNPNGNKTEVVENTDGSGKTTVTNTDGSSSTTTVSKDGKVESQVTLPAAVVDNAKDQAVALPMPQVPVVSDKADAPKVTVELPAGTSAKVEIPVKDVTPGTVAVIVKADGTEEIIKTSLTTETGVAVTLGSGDTVKIVDNSKPFDDVPGSYWGSDYVDFVASRELFAGTAERTFSPDVAMTRGMIVTVLAAYDGANTGSTGGAWYEAGQQWAMDNGVSDGTDMEQSLTREQLAVMLWRYAGSPAADSISGYDDAGSVSSWAAEAMAWAVENGLISGVDGGVLAPQGAATRAQVATILMRFVEKTA